MTMAPPIPVEIVRYRKFIAPRAAPNSISARAATFVSRSRAAGKPSAAPIGSRNGTSVKPGPKFGGSISTPVRGSSGPGEASPSPTMDRLISGDTAPAADCSSSIQARITACGPSAPGVRRSARDRIRPSAVTTAARIRVAPRSRARTGPEVTSMRWRIAPGKDGTPRRLSDGGFKVQDAGASATDLEHLRAALGAGAGQGRLAVLHPDHDGVLDFDLFLVLHAIGLRHVPFPPWAPCAPGVCPESRS